MVLKIPKTAFKSKNEASHRYSKNGELEVFGRVILVLSKVHF